MIRNKFIKAALFLVILVSTACESYLDLKPEDRLVREDFWQTKEQVESAVIAIYASMTDPRYVEQLFLWGELRADMMVPNIGAQDFERDVINGNILPTNRIADWSGFYRTINFCNTVIELAPQVLEKDPTFTEEHLNGLLAEAYALRALNYLYLVKGFKEVPLKLDATISDEVDFTLPKSTEEEIMTQVFSDLELAEGLAVLTYDRVAWDKGRVIKYTVNAIQADAHLWMGNFEECVAACDKIINSGQYGLVAGGDNPLWYPSLYGQGNSSESIFELQFNQPHTNPFFFMLSSNGGRRYLAAPNVIDEVFTLDEDNPLNVDIRLPASVNLENANIWKYLGHTIVQSRSANESDANFIIYRLPDILLMKAEALAFLADGRGQQVLDLIEVVRNRANALPATERIVTPDNYSTLVEYVLEERQREFAYEGKRWFDLLRVAKMNNYARLDLLISAVMENAPSDRQQSIVNKYRDKNSHYWPIPQSELERNPNLVQNPFYESF